MRKMDEMGNPNSCFSKATLNEMMFVLLARDSAAPATIRFWVQKRIAIGKNKPDDPQMVEALQCAEIMESERTIESGRETKR